MINYSRYFEELEDMFTKIETKKISNLTKKILETKEKNNTVFIIGNGGSASTASHWACDFGKGTLKRYYNDDKRLKVLSLTDNVATVTALANDLSYEEIFSQQLKNFIKEKDLLIALSGSGNSKNIINAIETAKKSKAYVFSLLGFDGGEISNLSNDYILIPSKNYGVIEDFYSIIGHLITLNLKDNK